MYCPNHNQLNECSNPDKCEDWTCLALNGVPIKRNIIFETTVTYKNENYSYYSWGNCSMAALNKVCQMLPKNMQEITNAVTRPNFEATWAQRAYEPQFSS